MSPDVPRRRPKTDPERLRNELAKSGARGADGATGDARRVNAHRRVDVYQPPSGGGITASGAYVLAGADPGLPGGGAGVSEESISFDEDVADAAYFQPAIMGDPMFPGITILQSGNYLAHGTVYVTGCDPGDKFRVAMENGNGVGGRGVSTGIEADDTGVAEWGGGPALIAVDGLGGVNLSVRQYAGTGIAPFLSAANVLIVKIG